MSTEQQRKMMECAAKACGPEYQYDELEHCGYKETDDDYFGNPEWNPLTSSQDCAEMCAELGINTYFNDLLGCANCYLVEDFMNCVDISYKDHDNSRLKAWMWAATMCAAKIGGYTE